MLVASPMVASAATVPVAYVGNATVDQNGQLSAPTASADVASTSYVKGAYNELAQAINTVNSNALTLSTAETGTYTNTGSGLTSTTIGAAITELGTSKQDKIDSSHKLDADLVDDSTSTNKFVTAAEKTAIANAITKDVNDLTNYTTTTDMNTALDGKQDTIDSTHKVSADLIDDSTSTNKFVTAAEKTAIANAITKDVNDLTNYTTTTDMNTALATKQDASKSTVATGTYNYITQGDGVATNLVNLDTAAKNAKDAADTAESHIGTLSGLSTTAKTDVVSAINEVAATAAADKYVTVHTTWGNDSATTSANVLTTTAPASGS